MNKLVIAFAAFALVASPALASVAKAPPSPARSLGVGAPQIAPAFSSPSLCGLPNTPDCGVTDVYASVATYEAAMIAAGASVAP